MIRKTLLLGAAALFAFADSTVNTATVKQLKKAYNIGIYDTLSVIKQDIKNFNKTETLKGYAVLININNLALTDVIKYEAFAIKIGLDPKLIGNQLIFTVHNRKADAEYIKNMIIKNSSIKPLIQYVDIKAKEKSIISTYTNEALPQKVLLVYVKEKPVNKNYYNNSQKITIAGNLDLHFVNRVLTTKTYNKKCKNKECKPKINITQAGEKQTIKDVTKTIGKKDIPLKGKNFYQLSKIISHYGIITHDNALIIGNHIFKAGNKLNDKFVLSYVDFDKGIIVIDNVSAIKVKKEGNK